jgi:hypothetical protein
MEIISKKIYKLLLENNNFLIITHKNPDGDAIGSVLAIKYFLENHGKNAHVFSSTIINEQFDFLPNFFSIKKKYIPKEDFDAIIVCDTGDIKHTGVKEEFIKKHKNIVNIDHHKSNDFFGTHNLISEKSSSTTEILFHFFKYNNIEIPINVAVYLLKSRIIFKVGVNICIISYQNHYSKDIYGIENEYNNWKIFEEYNLFFPSANIEFPFKIKNFGFNAYFTYFEKFNKNYDINFGLNFKLFDIKSR